MTEPLSEPPLPRPVWYRVFDRLTEMGQVLIPGMYVWAVTVVPVATAKGAPSLARLTAYLAFLALVAGVFSIKDRPKLGYGLAIWTFIGLSVCTWLLYPSALSVTKLDPIRAASGTLGWTMFALGWGTPWRPGVHPEDHPLAQLNPKLEPRKELPLHAPLAVVMTALGALTCLLLPWGTKEPSRALMMHGLGIACAVALVTAGGRIALSLGTKRWDYSPRQRFAFAFPWLMALTVLAIIGMAWRMGR